MDYIAKKGFMISGKFIRNGGILPDISQKRAGELLKLGLIRAEAPPDETPPSDEPPKPEKPQGGRNKAAKP